MNKLNQLRDIMQQAQVYASAWALVRISLDAGNEMENADAARAELFTMVRDALTATPLDADLARVVEPVGHVDGDDASRFVQWSSAVAAFDYAIGTPVYATPQAAAQPSQARELSDDEIVQVLSDCHKGCIYPQDYKYLPRAMRITEGRAIIAAINAKASA